MRPYALACLLALASFTLVAGACNFKLGDDTEGEMGNLRFSYSGPGCFFGCALDKKALQGAKVSVAVSGDTQGGLTGTIDEDTAATVSTQTEVCTCSSGSASKVRSRVVQNGQRCESGETMTCTMTIEVTAVRQGFSKLKVLDGKGAVVDQVDIAVRPAARLDLAVTSKEAAASKEAAVAPKDGVYTLKRHADARLSVKAFDSDGDELFWSRDGVTFTYDNEQVVYGAGASFSANADSLTVFAEGDATADVASAGETARATARFHVTP
ncbi:MAG: hypothetical protein JWO86_3387 [Myxococcaceae bacterium]|nr:hypothetical protein [Myxococcaceae bacterium]MEA2749353.1 hypothetical protein [Myxococcales bacterium]